MVTSTSKQAAVKNESVRDTQNRRVFEFLNFGTSRGNFYTAEIISGVLGIKISTLHARINDLKKGYTFGGKMYYAECKGFDQNSYGNRCMTWGVTNKEPDYKKELEQVENKLRALFAKRKQIKRAMLPNTPTLFTEMNA